MMSFKLVSLVRSMTILDCQYDNHKGHIVIMLNICDCIVTANSCQELTTVTKIYLRWRLVKKIENLKLNT